MPVFRHFVGSVALLAFTLNSSFLFATETLTLDAALKQVQSVNENAAIARERMVQADGAKREAYAEFLPTISLTGTYTPWSKYDGSYTNGLAQVDLRLLDPSSIPRVRQASRLYEAERLDADEMRRQLAFETANGFYLVLAAASLERAAERRLGVADEALRQSRVRAEAGLAERSVVTRSELESATARTELIRARSASLKTRYALFYLLGARPDQLQADQTWPTLQEPPTMTTVVPPFAELLKEALQQRGDIRSAQARAEGARVGADEPLTDTLPKLFLRGEANYTDDTTRTYRTDTTDWRASLVATWELYDGGARYGRRERLASVAREANLTVEAARRHLGLELSNGLSDLATAVASVAQAEARLKVAHQNSTETGLRFAQGLSTALEQADATVSEYEAEVELARSRFNQQQAQLTLEQTVGRWPTGTSAENRHANP